MALEWLRQHRCDRVNYAWKKFYGLGEERELIMPTAKGYKKIVKEN